MVKYRRHSEPLSGPASHSDAGYSPVVSLNPWTFFQTGQGIMQIGVVVGGVVITLIVCLIISLFLDTFVRTDISIERQSILSHISNALEDSEKTMRASTELLRLSGGDLQTVFAILSTPKGFDHLVWARETRPRIWEFSDVYVHMPEKKGETPLRWMPSPNFAHWAHKQGLVLNPHVRAFEYFPGLESSEEHNANSHTDAPFILTKALIPGNARAGVLIGRIRFGSLFDTKIAKGVTIFLTPGEKGDLPGSTLYKNGEFGGNPMVFRLSAAGRTFDATIDPDLGLQDQFLRSLPFYVGIMGFVITLIVLLFVRSQTLHTRNLLRVNRALEARNTDLEAEVQKREYDGAALRRTEKENQTIIDSVSDIIFEVDPDGRILFLNAAWCSITGMEEHRTLGQNLFAFLRESDHQVIRKSLESLERQGPRKTDRPQRMMTALRDRSGFLRSVEMTLSFVRQEGSGRIVGTITDVEERERAQTALRETENKFRAIVENAAWGIYQMTPNGLYVSVNPTLARILGYANFKDVLSSIKNAHRTVYVNSTARSLFVRELETKGEAYAPEVEIVRKDGTHIWVSENARAVKEEGTNIISYYEGSMEDITIRRAADIALREAKLQSDMANRAKSEFLTNMSHELRTPLNAVIGFSEIIKGETFGPLGAPEYKEYASDIYDNGRRLLSIINEILDISRIEAGERQLSETVLDLCAIIKNTIESVASKAKAANVNIIPSIKEPLALVGEERALKQIFSNLLSNAIKFTPYGGQIRIVSEIDTKTRAIMVSMTDTGIGMNQQEINIALSPFGQVDMNLARSGSGTGLGLTLVQALARLHGANFEIVSQKGIGTTVMLTFPPERTA